MDMTAEIKQAIANNLPAAVGDELKKRLVQADAAEKEVANLKARGEVQDREVASLKAELAKHKLMTERESDLSTRETELHLRELDVQSRECTVLTTIAQADAVAAKSERDSIFKLAEIALGKRAYTEKVERFGGKDVPDTSNSYGGTRHLNESQTTTRTVEETG